MTVIKAPELTELTQQILELRRVHPVERRLIIGIAGAPGSGKSTLSALLVKALNESATTAINPAVGVPMDGFHLDNAILDERNLRAVKGSPQTFDVFGLLTIIERLVPLSSSPVYVPLFDRANDLARNAATEINQSHSIVVLEGNYLLLDEANWRDINTHLDLSIMLQVPFEILEERLIQRWLDYEFSAEAAAAKAQENDLPNARLVVNDSLPATINVDNAGT